MAFVYGRLSKGPPAPNGYHLIRVVRDFCYQLFVDVKSSAASFLPEFVESMGT